MFGSDAGFVAKHYEMKKSCFRMDMLEYPYMGICREYGCPEIVPAFLRPMMWLMAICTLSSSGAERTMTAVISN